jgi:pilus assembly protein Flp/PilA
MTAVCTLILESTCGWNKKTSKKEKTRMKDKLLKLSVMLQILKDESGQDMIEYALAVALIGFTAIAGLSSVAAAINTAFTDIGTKLSTYIT